MSAKGVLWYVILAIAVPWLILQVATQRWFERQAADPMDTINAALSGQPPPPDSIPPWYVAHPELALLGAFSVVTIVALLAAIVVRLEK